MRIRSVRCGRRAHPRIRGEDVRVINREGEPWGSPPHSRGRPVQVVVEIHGRVQGSPPHSRGRLLRGAEHAAALRLTPAFAGKTPQDSLILAQNKAHPRIRGED